MPCRMNRKASEGPFGFLVAWLRRNEDPGVTDHSTHLEARLRITKEERDRGRARLNAQPGLAELLAFEADACGKESVGEPGRIS